MKKPLIVFLSIILVIITVTLIFFMPDNDIQISQESEAKQYKVTIILPEETEDEIDNELYTIVGNDLYVGDAIFKDCVDKLSTAESPYSTEDFYNYIAKNVPEYFSGECYLSVHSYLDDPYYTNIYADYASYEDSNLAELIQSYNEYPTCEIILLAADLSESVQIESCSKYIFKREVNYEEN